MVPYFFNVRWERLSSLGMEKGGDVIVLGGVQGEGKEQLGAAHRTQLLVVIISQGNYPWDQIGK